MPIYYEIMCKGIKSVFSDRSTNSFAETGLSRPGFTIFKSLNTYTIYVNERDNA